MLTLFFSMRLLCAVKNVSGRLLVGLRWSNMIGDDGQSQWIFQSFEDQRFIHQTDSNLFWLGVFLPPVVWTFLAFGAALTLRFMWLLLCLVALSLNAINAIGYVKCKRDAVSRVVAAAHSSRVVVAAALSWSVHTQLARSSFPRRHRALICNPRAALPPSLLLSMLEQQQQRRRRRRRRRRQQRQQQQQAGAAAALALRH